MEEAQELRRLAGQSSYSSASSSPYHTAPVRLHPPEQEGPEQGVGSGGTGS